MRWSLWFFGLPIITLIELAYITTYPRTFRWRAAAVGLPIAALSYLFWYLDLRNDIVYLTQVAAVGLYYFTKFREHDKARKRRRRKALKDPPQRGKRLIRKITVN